jgi:hypothetical protein
MNKAAVYQPNPIKDTDGTAVWPIVLKDIQARIDFGEQKYGTTLKTHNGRDPLWDAYQEAIDLVVYLRQAILEREGK